MFDGHRPDTWVSNVRPMNGRVQHHGPCDGHDGANGMLSVAVMVVSTCASKTNMLTQILKVKLKRMGWKSGSVVRKVRLGNDSIVERHGLICLPALDSFIAVETFLKFNMNVIHSVIEEDAASRKHLIVPSFAF
jgi:hypothetical protein